MSIVSRSPIVAQPYAGQQWLENIVAEILALDDLFQAF
jgi:hypothetical protein